MNHSSQKRYSTGAMLFHWVIAIAVIVTWRIADAAEHSEMPAKAELFGYHKAIGIIILALTLGRLIWRWSHKVPPLPSSLAKWEAVLARAVHTIFYIMLVALPLGGWLANSLNGRSIDMFGWFDVPALPVGADKVMGGSIYDLHALGGKFLIILVGLHILGALKHTFVDKNGGIFRMLPFGKVPD